MNFSISCLLIVDQKFTFTKEKNERNTIFEEIVIIRIIFENENREKNIRNIYINFSISCFLIIDQKFTKEKNERNTIERL